MCIKCYFFEGYGEGSFAPANRQPADGMYLAAHTVIKAHASAYHLYDDAYRAEQGGKIGITLNSNWVEPGETLNPDHIEASVSGMCGIVMQNGNLLNLQ